MGSKEGLEFFLLAYLLSAIAPPVAFALDPFQESSGQVVMEAESYDARIPRSGKSWLLRAVPSGYSGTGYLRAVPNTGVLQETDYATLSPELQYRINFTTTGTYYVWVRGEGLSAEDNSLHAGIDGTTPTSADKIGDFSFGWRWRRYTLDSAPATLEVTAPGVHTLNLWMREDGFMADKILLTTDSSFVPSDLGPPESPRVDAQPPAISDVQLSTVTNVSAAIAWTTDEPSGSQVEYGPDPSYGSTTPMDPSLVTSHAVTLTGLASAALYHYRVISEDGSGNVGSSADATFTTLPDPPVPTIDPIPFLILHPELTVTGTKSPEIVEVVVSLSGSSVSPVVYPTSTSWSLLLQGLSTGEYTVTVEGIDAQGLASPLSSETFNVDTDSAPWLISQKVPNDIVPSPYPGRENLLISYDIPQTDPVYSILYHRSYSYDDAVGAIGLLLWGDVDRARAILQALSGLVDEQGRIGFSYNTANNFSHLLYKTGTIAWVGYAMALFERMTGETQFQVAAQAIADYLLTLQDTNPATPSYGSLKAGPTEAVYSTEHNIDAYFFLREIGSLLSNASYLNTATEIENSLLAHHWNEAGHFDQGVGDPSYALDASSWGAIFLNAVGEIAKAQSALSFVESTFRNTQTITGTPQTVTGYAPYAQDVVWGEGSLGVATAYRKLGMEAQADAIVTEMLRLRGLNGGLYYAMPTTTVVTGDVFYEWESVASTGWLLMEENASGFWSPPPLSRPEFAPLASQNGAEGSLLSFAVSAMDPAGGPLTYSAENLPAGGSFNPATRTFSWTPGYDQAGTYEVYCRVSNGTLEDIMSVDLAVADTPIANSFPTIDPIPSQVAGPNSILTFSVVGRDPNQTETVTLSVAGLPSWLAIQSNMPGNPATLTLSGSSGSDTTASYTLTFTALDSGEPPLSVSQNVTLTVDRSAPSTPNVNSVTSPTAVSPYPLSGTKQANTSIWMNGVEVVPFNSSTSWNYPTALTEGENILTITAKDSVLNESAPRQVTLLYYRNVAPLPDILTVVGAGDQKNADLAIFQKRTYLVWEDAASGEIFFNRSEDGGLNWELAPLSLGSGTYPRITTDQLGRVYVVWSEGEIDAAGPIWVRKSDDGGATFTPSVQASVGYVPDIAVSSEGTYVYVAFHHKVGDETRASCARSINGGVSFEPEVQASEFRSLNDGLYPTLGIRIETTPDGQYVWIGFTRLYTNQGKAILARSTNYGVSFETPNLVLNPESHNGGHPTPLFLNGTLYASFKHNSYGENHIYLRKSTNFGATWNSKVRVDDGEQATTDYETPSIAADANGCLYVTFVNVTEGGGEGDLPGSLHRRRSDLRSRYSPRHPAGCLLCRTPANRIQPRRKSPPRCLGGSKGRRQRPLRLAKPGPAPARVADGSGGRIRICRQYPWGCQYGRSHKGSGAGRNRPCQRWRASPGPGDPECPRHPAKRRRELVPLL